MMVQNCSKVAMDREAWKRIVEQVVAPGEDDLLPVHTGV
jgi:hypothetical protein